MSFHSLLTLMQWSLNYFLLTHVQTLHGSKELIFLQSTNEAKIEWKICFLTVRRSPFPKAWIVVCGGWCGRYRNWRSWITAGTQRKQHIIRGHYRQSNCQYNQYNLKRERGGREIKNTVLNNKCH